VKSLSPLAYAFNSTFNGKPCTQTGVWPMITVCESWMLRTVQSTDDADCFIKERLSLVELGLRMRADKLSEANAKLDENIANILARMSRKGAFRLPGDPAEGLRAGNKQINDQFRACVGELNVRLRQADTGREGTPSFCLDVDRFEPPPIEAPPETGAAGQWHPPSPVRRRR
jgi:hypothetical protein